MTTLKELMNLRERRVLITGATGHLGKVMAETLAELGADLILVDRPGSEFDAIEKCLTQSWPVSVECKATDLEIQAERTTLIKSLLDGNRRLDVLINNAGFTGTSDLQGWGGRLEAQSVETWRRAIEVNLTAAFHLCQGLMPLLSASGNGSIVNVASIYGVLGPDWSLYAGTSMTNPAAYAASKGGLIQLTRWLATTAAPSVRANSISPGGIARGQPRQFVDRYIARTPLARMATEDDFRGAIAYLASDLSNYVTGQDLLVDGGWSAW
jgi:NAD(P)-dependent dehydrogenase (short-subunit alcohol dehydrogenase family)